MLQDIKFKIDHIQTQMKGYGYPLVGVALIAFLAVHGAGKMETVQPVALHVVKTKAYVTPAQQQQEAQMQMDELRARADRYNARGDNAEAQMQDMAARLNEIEPQAGR
jgi:hypothetical protein